METTVLYTSDSEFKRDYDRVRATHIAEILPSLVVDPFVRVKFAPVPVQVLGTTMAGYDYVHSEEVQL